MAFGWLAGRAGERTRWRYFDRVAGRAAHVPSLLEVQAGVGAMIGRLPSLPGRVAATEGYPPSVARAAPWLRGRGVDPAVTSQVRTRPPFAAGTFGLVVSRHPVEDWGSDVIGVLRPGGTYLAQHIGPHSCAR